MSIFLIFLLGCIVYQGIYYYKTNMRKKYNKIEYPDNFKTGDVIFFAHQTHMFANSMMTMSMFSHVGIIINDKLIEISGDGEHKTKKIMFNEIDNRLKTYDGTVFIMRLNNAVSVDQLTNVCTYLNSQNCEYLTLGKFILSFFGINNHEDVHCASLVLHLIDKLFGTNLYKKSNYINAFKTIEDLPYHNKLLNNYYDEIKKIIC